jgi:hypothetical protein
VIVGRVRISLSKYSLLVALQHVNDKGNYFFLENHLAFLTFVRVSLWFARSNNYNFCVIECHLSSFLVR